METIFLPTIKGMKEEGRTFKGCLYFGLMITKNGPKVIEYNCRFGDPETQVVLPLLESDLFTIMKATTNGTLKDTEVKFSKNSAACVVMASNGYPQKYETGKELIISDDIKNNVYVAGAKFSDNTLLTAGGRVLGVTAVADDLKSALSLAYERVNKVNFSNAFYRKDIGKKALEVLEG
jgi:phosphoribosylamine--glycine ligase